MGTAGRCRIRHRSRPTVGCLLDCVFGVACCRAGMVEERDLPAVIR